MEELKKSEKSENPENLEELYSRQLYLLGNDSIELNNKFKVLIIGLSGLGTEILRNLVLLGIGNITIYDTNMILYSDIKENFYLSMDDIGKNKTVCFCEKFRSMNKYVNIDIIDNINDDNLFNNDLVISTQHDLYDNVVLDNKLRNKGIKFINTFVNRYFGYIFCDFINFDVIDYVNYFVISIKDRICILSENHNLEVGDIIILDDKHVNIVKIIDKKTLMLDSDVYIKKITKVIKKKLKYISMDDSLFNPVFSNVMRDQDKMHTLNIDMDIKHKNHININIMLIPIIGGIVSHEVIKVSCNRFYPIYQWFYYNINDLKLKSLNNSAKILILGAGALGCEHAKIINKLGFRNVCIADMDAIEKTNLNRQYIFTDRDIGKLKSVILCKRFGYHAITSKFCKENINKYNINGYDVILLAVDNEEARSLMSECCIRFKKPMIDCGTLGDKGSVLVTYPCKTRTYIDYNNGVIDDENIALCTIKMFPYKIEHIIEWAINFVYNMVSSSYSEIELEGLWNEEFNENINMLLEEYSGEFWKDKMKPTPFSKIDGKFIEMSEIFLKNVHNQDNQLKYITYIANQRAKVYGFDKINMSDVNKVINKIIPSIITTTSVCSCMAVIELCKILQKAKIKNYENSFFNLSLPLFYYSKTVYPAYYFNGVFSFTGWDIKHIKKISELENINVITYDGKIIEKNEIPKSEIFRVYFNGTEEPLKCILDK